MGGGKTHLLVGFGLLARHPELRRKYCAGMAAATAFGRAQIAAFNGRNSYLTKKPKKKKTSVQAIADYAPFDDGSVQLRVAPKGEIRYSLNGSEPRNGAVYSQPIAIGDGEPVRIVEDFGYRGLEGGLPREEERMILARAVWSAIAPAARNEFNDRLKQVKLLTCRWHTGVNLVDRLLGKELCVLAWAAESATADQLPVIASKWAALRPEERWWLFAMTVAEAGLPEDKERGWRRALFFALSDGEKPPPDRPRRAAR